MNFNRQKGNGYILCINRFLFLIVLQKIQKNKKIV